MLLSFPVSKILESQNEQNEMHLHKHYMSENQSYTLNAAISFYTNMVRAQFATESGVHVK